MDDQEAERLIEGLASAKVSPEAYCRLVEFMGIGRDQAVRCCKAIRRQQDRRTRNERILAVVVALLIGGAVLLMGLVSGAKSPAKSINSTAEKLFMQ